MKTTLISLLLSATMLTVLSTRSLAQTSGDEAAIRQLVHHARLAFNKRDLKTFADYFVESPSLYYQVLTPDNQLLMARGWEAMTHMVGNHMKNDPQDFPADPTPTPMTDTHSGQGKYSLARWNDLLGKWRQKVVQSRPGHSRKTGRPMEGCRPDESDLLGRQTGRDQVALNTLNHRKPH